MMAVMAKGFPDVRDEIEEPEIYFADDYGTTWLRQCT